MLPTPQARDGDHRGAADPVRRRALGHQVSLHDAVNSVVKLLPTLTAADSRSAAIQTVLTPGHPIPKGCVAITDSVRLLPTPTAINPNDGEETSNWLERRERHLRRKINGNGMGMPLSIAVRLLPTPTASDARASTHRTHEGGPLSTGLCRLFRTPSTSDSDAPEVCLPTSSATGGTKECPAQRRSKGDQVLPSAIIRLMACSEPDGIV